MQSSAGGDGIAERLRDESRRGQIGKPPLLTDRWQDRPRLQASVHVGGQGPHRDQQVRPGTGHEIDSHQTLDCRYGADDCQQDTFSDSDRRGIRPQTEAAPFVKPYAMAPTMAALPPMILSQSIHMEICENCVATETAPITIATVESAKDGVTIQQYSRPDSRPAWAVHDQLFHLRALSTLSRTTARMHLQDRKHRLWN